MTQALALRLSQRVLRCSFTQSLTTSAASYASLQHPGFLTAGPQQPADPAWRPEPLTGCLTHCFGTTSHAADTADAAAAQRKRHALKCNTAAGTAVSQAVACMVDRDVMPRQQLVSRMDQLSQQLSQQVAQHSSTELSAFVEACRKMDYQHRAAFQATIHHLAPTAASLPADELPSLLWAASTLAEQADTSSSSSSGSTTQQQQQQQQEAALADTALSSSSSRGRVPQNDGVIGSVNSSRIAHMPQVVQFMLGASQVLSGDLDSLDCQELPIIAAALADLEYRDPFLLTALAETVLERGPELSDEEMLQLVQSFAGMGRWFFDGKLIEGLTAEFVRRARAGRTARHSVDRLESCLAGINHRSKVLEQYVQEAGGAAK